MIGKKFLGIDFAPFWVPLDRRLQTIGAAIMMFNIALGGVVSWCLTAYFMFYGSVWIRTLVIGYLIYIYYNKDARFKGSWSNYSPHSKWLSDRFRSMSIWRHFCNYFPIKIIKTVELNPSKNYLFCYFPHGMIASGATGAFATNGADCDKIFPGLDFHMVTLDQNFNTPFIREFLLLLAGRSCDAKSLEHLLSSNDGRGRIVIIAIGGSAEAFKCRPGTHEILLKKRKGFVKVALKTGAPLVPVYAFGETDLFDQVDNPKGSWLRAIQELYKKYTGFAPIIPIGRGFFQYSFGLIPRRKSIFVVVGAPIEVPKIEEPTREDIDKYHAIFTDSLIDLFETHKKSYIKNHENVSLVLADD